MYRAQMRCCSECGCYLPDGADTCLACHHVEGSATRTEESFSGARPDNTSAALYWQYAMMNPQPPAPYNPYRYYEPHGVPNQCSFGLNPYLQLEAQIACNVAALNQEVQLSHILQNLYQPNYVLGGLTHAQRTFSLP